MQKVYSVYLHRLVRSPTYLSTAQFMRFLRIKSSLMMEIQSTVGRTEKSIGGYTKDLNNSEEREARLQVVKTGNRLSGCPRVSCGLGRIPGLDPSRACADHQKICGCNLQISCLELPVSPGMSKGFVIR